MSKLDRIKRAVRSVIEDRLPDVDIVSVNVEPDFDEEGDRILRIMVVLESGDRTLDPAKSSGLIRHLRPELANLGEDSFPVISFVSQSELKDLEPAAA